MADYKIPLVASFDNRQAYSSFYTPTRLAGPYLKNGLVDKDTVTNDLYVQTRPGIKLHDYDSNGIYGAAIVQLGTYSDQEQLITARGQYIYKQAASNVNPTLNTSSVHDMTAAGPTDILQLPDGEVFIKNSGHAVHYDGTTDTTISDADYPSATILGSAYLDGFVYVADIDGAIYNSDLADSTSWTATNFISANRNNDVAVWLGKHHDNLVLISSNSIEFFYDAGNPSGSPLRRRTDVFYSKLGGLRPPISGGAYSYSRPVCQIGEDIYFIGHEEEGSLGLYRIKNFAVERISTPYLDKQLALTASLYSSNNVILSAFHIAHKEFITIASMNSSIDQVLLYDVGAKIVTDLESNLTQFTGSNKNKLNISHAFNLLYKTTSGATLTNDPAAPIFVTRSGYLCSLTPNISLDYDAYSASTGYDIDLVIRTPEWDADTSKYKFVYELRLDSDLNSSESVDISWTDDDYITFTTARSLSLIPGRKLSRLGRTTRRAWQLEYSGQEYLQFNALEAKASLGFT